MRLFETLKKAVVLPTVAGFALAIGGCDGAPAQPTAAPGAKSVPREQAGSDDAGVEVPSPEGGESAAPEQK